jgi:hypothetical protein
MVRGFLLRRHALGSFSTLLQAIARDYFKGNGSVPASVLVEEKTGLPVFLAEDPLSAVVIGAGLIGGPLEAEAAWDIAFRKRRANRQPASDLFHKPRHAG